MNSNSDKPSNATKDQAHPFLDLIISIVTPSIILMKFSGDEHLGAVYALITALAFPLVWGLLEFLRYEKFNFIAILGLVSVLLTGGIGLLQLDNQWLAIKEAAIPAIIGIAVLISTRTPFPLIRTLIFNAKIFDVTTIQEKLEISNTKAEFETKLLNATYWLSGTFFFSSIMNYLLAKWIVTSPTGTAGFNEELGRMTLLSYPIIAIPSMLMMIAIVYHLWRTIHNLTGLTLEQMMVSESLNDNNN